MISKRCMMIELVLGVVFFILVPLVVLASSPVAGHRAERKVILISGYDTQYNLPLQDNNRLHTRNDPNTETEIVGWHSIIDYLTFDIGTTENLLVRRIGLTNDDFVLFSYSGQYDATCNGGTGYGCPRYRAKDTCLTANHQPNQPLYCQVEAAAIIAATNYLTNVVNAYSNADFDIIAHSEGGIVATYWAATASPTLLQRINSVITLDSPLQGKVLLNNIGTMPGGIVDFLTPAVKNTIAQAPSRVPIHTIRNTADWAVPPQYATISGVWNDSGDDIYVQEGSANHEPRNDARVLQRIALTLVAGKIIGPNGQNPAQIKIPSFYRPFITVQMAKPTFKGRDLTVNDIVASVGGESATVYPGLGWRRGYTPFVGGRSLLAVSTLEKPNGTYPITISTQNTQIPFSDTEVNAVRYASPHYDMILVIDRSDSMTAALYDIKTAASAFIDSMQVGDKIGVISFSTNASVDFPLTTITSDSTKQDAQVAIDAINVGDYTSLGSGLQAGLDQINLSGDSTHTRVLVLISDGNENRSPFIADILPQLVRSRLAVHSIGYGVAWETIEGSESWGVNSAKLQEIAAQTGGTYRYVFSAEYLLNSLNSIFFGMRRLENVAFAQGSSSATSRVQRRNLLTAGTPTDLPALVDASISEISVNLYWANSTVNFDFELVKPDGTVITPSTNDPNIRYVATPISKSYRITSPASGTWNMRVTLTTPGTTEAFSVSADAETGVRMSFGTNLHIYAARIQPMVLWAQLIDTAPILGSTINATVTRPDGNTVVIPLLDDGQHLDGSPNDGVYSAIFTDTMQAGDYIVTLTARGSSNAGQQFARMGQTTAVVNPNSVPISDLYVTLTSPVQVKAGAPLTYTITYGNNGPDACDGVAISSLFPASTIYLADSRGNSSDLFGVGRLWRIGTLNAASQGNFTLSVSIPITMPVGSRLTNRASIFVQPSVTLTLPSEPNFDNNSADATTNSFGLSFLPLIMKNSQQGTQMPSIQSPFLGAYPGP